MVRVVRGDGPLRPVAARQRGYEGNESPLYKLFQAFRRSSPQGKNGLWSRVLVVKNNDSAQEMADNFAKGETEYLDDEPWWQLVEEEDKKVLGQTDDPADPPVIPVDFVDKPDADPVGGDAGEPEPPAPPPPPPRRALHELTRKYVHPTFRVEYEVEAFAVRPDDPDLVAGAPWAFRLDEVATRTYAFLVDPRNEMFRSTTMTPLDALLTELTHRTIDFLKGQAQDVTVAGVLADFRREYCVDSRLDPAEIIAFAAAVLDEIARAVPRLLAPGQGDCLHAELTDGREGRRRPADGEPERREPRRGRIRRELLGRTPTPGPCGGFSRAIPTCSSTASTGRIPTRRWTTARPTSPRKPRQACSPGTTPTWATPSGSPTRRRRTSRTRAATRSSGPPARCAC